jgi:uncharacterized protein with PIN domain
VKPFTIRLNFFGDLGFFLGSKFRSQPVERRLRERTSIKDVIESCGVPHPEVDAILVNGQAVGFDHTLVSDTEVKVFPVANRDTLRADKHLQETEISRFVADGHLGKLTRNLRLFGFDTAYSARADDRELLDIMARENRALLTRDRRLLMHSIVQHGYCPRSQTADEQTAEVLGRFNLVELIAPFTRCLRCNAPLQDTTKAEVINDLAPLTKIYYDQFCRCPGCGQVYWAGSHFQKLEKRIERIQARLVGKRGD